MLLFFSLSGQLEILLYSKGRSPSVRLRAADVGTYINADLWLHGSCASITQGMVCTQTSFDAICSQTYYVITNGKGDGFQMITPLLIKLALSHAINCWYH